MCGLVAIYSNQTINFNPKTLKAMTDSIQHRGPDDYGFSFNGPDITMSWKGDLPDNIISKGMQEDWRKYLLYLLEHKKAMEQENV